MSAAVTNSFAKIARVTGLAAMMTLIIAAPIASSAQSPSQSSDNELLKQLLAHPTTSKGTVTFPIVFCWYKGLPALYIQTDASSPRIAEQQEVNLVRRLSNAIHAPNGAVDDIYVITNFKQGNVIPSAPIPAGPINRDLSYTPLWQVTTVTWHSGIARRVLTSEEDVLGARDNGEVSLTKTNIVLNCPVIYTPQGGKLPKITIHLEN